RDVEVGVRLLAERPTLGRLVDGGDHDARDRFLARFAATGGLDGCGVLGVDGPPGAGELWWGRVTTATTEWQLIEADDGDLPWLAAARPMPGPRGVWVACGRRIDEAVTTQVAGQVGLPVRILSASEARASAGGRLAAMLGAAAGDGRTAAGRDDAIDAFVDVRPLDDPSGAVHGVIETRLAAGAVDASVRRLERAIWIALAVAVPVMVVAAFVLARRLTAPLAELTRASARIGAGEMTVPVPRWARGEVAQLATTMEDMRTALLSLTSELRRRHAELASILNGVVEGVWAVDRNRRITWINRQAAERLGIRAEDALGKFCGDVLEPRLPGGARPCDTRCPIVDARFRGSARAVEHLAQGDEARRTVVITSAAPADADGDDEGEVRQFQVMRDETDAEAGRRLRDALLANVSHEFRTPLSAQIASLEMLKERIEEDADPDTLALVRATERGTLRLQRLVDNLLESLRLDSGVLSIRTRPVRLEQVIDQAVEQITPLVEQKRQSLTLSVPASYPELPGDGPRLVQVLVNLLANANKFAPAGTAIRLGGEVSDTRLAIWVQDEGPGFPEEYDAVEFAPFARASTEEPAEPGIGLGLYIAHSIVTRHGGRLVASNTRPGARVSIVFPREAADEDPRR
ncbi:MAG TPA: ATP-binding protein, partial [Candidatus Polarisedimenticolaceae bacterium]|nr:ATP-binding protein [Candidatus Polarisedimenticolaceae bacterium]